MKRFKKSLATLLVLVFVLSIVSTGFAAVDESSPSVVRAQALGILKGDDKGNLNLDKPITRAEAVTLIVRLLGLEKSAELMKGQTKFKDVTADHWASGHINVGVGQGVLNGYPDGTFKPSNNVTYAEMAKMLLYAMNYGVTVEGAPWPSGVMAKADDLGIFDGVNAVPNLPALRGDVVEMIDNSLTIKHLKQVGYGDLKQYIDGDETFLSKMDVEEIDGRVTAVDVKDNELTIDPDDDDKKTKTYTLLDEEIDIESLLGVKVTAWVNKKGEIFFIDANMDDVKVDMVAEDVAEDADEIELKLADDSFDVAKDVKVYINGQKKDLEDLKEGMYGYFVFDDDEIVYINVKDWNEVEAGVVTEVDVKNNIITYFDETGSEDEIDLDDADDYVITLDGKKIDLDDIEKNDVIYVAEYNDTYHVLVVRKAVEGEVERASDGKVKIDGTTYKVSDKATYSLNEDKKIAAFSIDKVKDMTGEEATAILDIAGYIRHITSAVDATSATIYGVVTRANDYNDNFKIFANGKSASYDLDGDVLVYDGSGWVDVTDSYDIQDATKNGKYLIVKFALDKDGEIDNLYVLGVWDNAAKEIEGPIVGKDKDVYEYEVVDTNLVTIDKFDDKRDRIETTGTDGRPYVYYVTSTTSIIDEITDMDAVEWDDIKGKDANDAQAVVVYNDKDDAKLVVFVNDTFSKIVDDVKVGVVLDKFVEDGDWKATVRVYDGDTEDYIISGRNSVNVGEVIEFYVNSDNELTLTDVGKIVYEDRSGNIVGLLKGKVEEKDGNYLTVNNVVYRIDSSTLIYDVTKGLDDIAAAKLSNIKVDKSVVGLVTDGKLIKVLYILGEGQDTGGSDDDVEYDAIVYKDFEVGGSDKTIRLTINGAVKSYNVLANALVEDQNGDEVAEGKTIKAGAKIKFVLVEGTTNIDYIKVVDGTITGTIE